MLNRFIIDGYVDSYHYDSVNFSPNSTHEDDHHSNFVSFLKDQYSEPFMANGQFHTNFCPAKYSPSKDQTNPFIYGNESYHFHRWIRTVWQISPVPDGVDFNDHLRLILESKDEFLSSNVAKLLAT